MCFSSPLPRVQPGGAGGAYRRTLRRVAGARSSTPEGSELALEAYEKRPLAIDMRSPTAGGGSPCSAIVTDARRAELGLVAGE